MGSLRWQDNWLVLAPPGAVRVDLDRRGASGNAIPLVASLATGGRVVIAASGPRAARRCREFAAAAELEVERSYLAFPSARAPAYIVEDDPAPLRLFLQTILAAPPGRRFSKPLAAVVALVRALSPSRAVRALAPGRIVLGRRL
jgi:hypothetical protein